MCSLNDFEMDGDSNKEMKKSNHKVLTESDLCRKCQINNAKFILRDKDFYCTQCFTVYFVHKFRSTIGKSREIKHGDKVLVAFSGGISSTCLLHLIRQGLDEPATKKLQFHPHVLFINESILNSQTSLAKIYEEIDKLNFPLSYTNLEEVLVEESKEISIKTVKSEKYLVEFQKYLHKFLWKLSENYSELLEVLRSSDLNKVDNISDESLGVSERSNELQHILSESLKNQTSREDFLRQLRYKLICRCAKQLGFQKVFLGCSGTELAIQILSNVALGRGSQIADFVQFKTNHFGVEVFLPMRETFEDEVKFFIESQNIFVPEEEEKLTPSNKPSIVSCTRAFIHNLQEEFFSTVPTVFRTGSKLVRGKEAENENEGLEGDVCSFCGLKRDTGKGGSSSALNSIKLSKKLTENQFMKGVIDNQDDFSDKENLIDDGESEVYNLFCYGCANLMQELDYQNSSSRVQHLLVTKKSEQQNLDIIQNYLLERGLNIP
ncbi:Cytoplasmic tRNA 2-thiolation protein 2-A [Armadillidium nasatum]|uniref:Cytoplasmic tRNA 2-thiolation protein 2 n=1 Tax=Armadillidium nasatum TaxID=96803 RepID=A0A5N5SQ18_9CRUS|nr:Cytoplasmic tRNA 2-thiolation protein 2-A [Armadillidium nasatum]